MRYLLILWLSVLPCCAQFGVAEQPMFALTSVESGEFTPYSIPGLAYYWTARDFTNAAAGTTTNRWVDHIQGYLLTNGDSTRLPMITSTGLWFHGATGDGFHLTNSLLDLEIGANEGSLSVFVTLRVTTLNGNNTFLDKRDVTRKRWVWYNDAQADTYAGGSTWASGQGAVNVFGLSGGKVPYNQNNTICLVLSNFWNGVANITSYGYTNGALGTSITGEVDFEFDTVGCSLTDLWVFNGVINEIIIYTNILTPTQVSNLNVIAYKP